MTVDLLEFEGDDLYFNEPMNAEAQRLLDTAAEHYGQTLAERALMRAYFIEPEHPMVLVALYRYFYYQHRLEDALIVADRVLRVFAARLGLPQEWRELTQIRFQNGVLVSMTLIRFYLLALKGAGFLELRLGLLEEAIERLQKVVDLDSSDRLGARALLSMACEHVKRPAGPVSA